MQTYEQTLAAGEVWALDAPGELVRIIDSTAAVDLQLTQHGTPFAEAKAVQAGLKVRPSRRFTGIRITNGATPQVVKVFIAEGDVEYDRPQVSGSISVANLPADQGAFSQAQKTVTSADGQLLAAKANRRYLNNDAAGDIYVTLDGTAAATAKGIKIAAGGSYELATYCPAGEIRAIGSIPNNANVVAVEG
jgi:hypothetical protein